MMIKSIRSSESWHLAQSFSDVVTKWELLGFIYIRFGGIVEDRDQKDISKGNLIAKAELASSLTDELLKRV